VRGWRFVQRHGDAIFIPAGCPHQVRNLSSCIKVALDFVSPENAHRCVQLTDQFAKLPRGHHLSEDKLQVKTMLLHAMSHISAALHADPPDFVEPDEPPPTTTPRGASKAAKSAAAALSENVPAVAGTSASTVMASALLPITTCSDASVAANASAEVMQDVNAETAVVGAEEKAGAAASTVAVQTSDAAQTAEMAQAQATDTPMADVPNSKTMEDAKAGGVTFAQAIAESASEDVKVVEPDGMLHRPLQLLAVEDE